MTDQLRIRMYNVGFGDCFLVTVQRAGTRWRMLVDCGSHSQGQARPIEDVVTGLIADLKDEGDPKIDVIVATHRHADHVSGFALDQWTEVDVGEVWLSYVEDEDDSDAQGLGRSLTEVAQTLAAGVQQQRALSPDSQLLQVADSLALNALPNQGAMDRLLGRGRKGFATPHALRFLPSTSPASNSMKPTAGVTVHAIGPSRDQADLRRLDPPKSAAWLRLDGPTTAEDQTIGADTALFSTIYTAEPQTISSALNDQRRGAGLTDLNHDESFLNAAARLDRVLNNTSVFLVLEVDELVLVFPGDSQQGAWEYVRRSDSNRELLAAATFYKIGHHGSHNATPRPFLDEDWTAGGYAMLPWARVKRWDKIPKPELMTALAATHAVIRIDEPLVDPEVRFHENEWSELVFPL